VEAGLEADVKHS